MESFEQEILELEDYIQDFWEFLPTAIAYVNPVGIIVDTDLALAQLLELPREDIIGTRLQDYSPQKETIAQIEKETIEKDFVKEREILITSKQGREIPVNFSTSIRKDAEGNVVGYFVSLNDLSVTKKIQDQLQSKLQELEDFHDLAVGRELKMIELEKEVNSLLTELGRKSKYETS